MILIRTYSELILLPTFLERYKYLRLGGSVGEDTFGFDRYLNQLFYRTEEWKSLRRDIILRDHGCDLAIPDLEINGMIYVHHMNPIRKQDVLERSDFLLNPNYLVCVSKRTHDAIHYGDETSLYEIEPIIRTKNDTIPWKQ